MNTVSMETTWAFESSMDQLDSMNARGYGVLKRTHFHLFVWEKKDWIHIGAIIFVAILGLFVIDFRHFSLFAFLILVAITVLIGSEIVDLAKRFKK